ncbi:MAG: hypothetical protein M1133_08930 [Armatimonadetes bacterium]|nr:hypothetical protein [Armatimonadota bacterium]
MVTALLVVVAVLMAATLIVLVVGLLLYIRRLNDAVVEIQATHASLREKIVPLAEDARRLIVETNGLVVTAREQVGRIQKLADSVEQILEGKPLTRAASAAVSTSRTTLISVVEGIKQGIHALRTRKGEHEESGPASECSKEN